MARAYNYARMARTAQRLIDRFGKLETLSMFTDSPGGEDAPNRLGRRISGTENVKAVFLEIDTKLIDGLLIKQGDMKVLMSPLDLTIPPQMTGTLTRGDEIWSVVKCRELNLGGVKLLYTLQVRR